MANPKTYPQKDRSHLFMWTIMGNMNFFRPLGVSSYAFGAKKSPSSAILVPHKYWRIMGKISFFRSLGVSLYAFGTKKNSSSAILVHIILVIMGNMRFFRSLGVYFYR